MWLGAWTTGEALEDRLLCLIVHYVLCLNLLCLIVSQILVMILFGPHTHVSLTWAMASAGLFLAHAAFALFFAWLDGDELGIGAGAEFGPSEGASGFDAGASGDGGSGG